MAVSQRGHWLMERFPRSTRSRSWTWSNAHHADSMYEESMVRYGFSQSIQTPKLWKSDWSCARLSSANSLQSSMKFCSPYSSMSFFDSKPSSSSTFVSMGSPCMS